MLAGVDVSNWQGAIDWQQVAAAGYSFAICKATEGVSYTDPWCIPNWQGLAAAGMARGCYHFARPDLNDPRAEANYLLARISSAGGLSVGDVLALDLEAGYGNLRSWALTWLQTVEAACGFKPLLYSSASFLESHGCTGDDQLAQYGLWQASWGSVPPMAAPGWPFWAIWQHSDHGSVPGIAGPVDLNQFDGTVEQFRAYGSGGTEPAPIPPAPPFTAHDFATVEAMLVADPPQTNEAIAYLERFV